MEKKQIQNYRGIKPAELVYVLEGDGSEGNPFKNEAYVVVWTNIDSVTRMKTLGKVAELTEEERSWFDN